MLSFSTLAPPLHHVQSCTWMSGNELIHWTHSYFYEPDTELQTPRGAEKMPRDAKSFQGGQTVAKRCQQKARGAKNVPKIARRSQKVPRDSKKWWEMCKDVEKCQKVQRESKNCQEMLTSAQRWWEISRDAERCPEMPKGSWRFKRCQEMPSTRFYDNSSQIYPGTPCVHSAWPILSTAQYR